MERNLNLSKKISYRSRYSSDSNIIDNMNDVFYNDEEEKIENEIFLNDKPLINNNNNLTQTLNNNNNKIENIKNENNKKQIKIICKILDTKNMKIKNKEQIIQNSSKKMEKNSKGKIEIEKDKKFFNPFAGYSSNVPNSISPFTQIINQKNDKNIFNNNNNNDKINVFEPSKKQNNNNNIFNNQNNETKSSISNINPFKNNDNNNLFKNNDNNNNLFKNNDNNNNNNDNNNNKDNNNNDNDNDNNNNDNNNKNNDNNDNNNNNNDNNNNPFNNNNNPFNNNNNPFNNNNNPFNNNYNPFLLNNSAKIDFDFSTTKNDAKEENEEEEEINDPNDDNNKPEKTEEIIKNENCLFIKDIPHLKKYDYEAKKFISKGEGRISIEKFNIENKEIYKLIMRNPKSKLIFYSGKIEKKTSFIIKNENKKFVLLIKNLLNFEQEKKNFFYSSILIKFHNENDENEFINIIKKIIN